MAIITSHIQSRAMRMCTSVAIALPTYIGEYGNDYNNSYSDYYEKAGKLPVLWLLHGGTDMFSDWHRFTPIETFANKYRIAVVMPTVQNSSYANMAHGPKWWDYISEDLPEFIYKNFPISRAREDNFVAGMSMGGLGTLKLALNHPERYAAAGGIATAVNLIKQFRDKEPHAGPNSFIASIYGSWEDAMANKIDDCYYLLEENVKKGVDLPKLLIAVGTEDFTYAHNVEFRDFAKKLGVEIEWIEAPGVHNWESWNLYIEKIFDWLPIRKG